MAQQPSPYNAIVDWRRYLRERYMSCERPNCYDSRVQRCKACICATGKGQDRLYVY